VPRDLRFYRFFFLNRTPGPSPFRNSMPAADRSLEQAKLKWMLRTIDFISGDKL
jgi:hypothetical protein